MSGAVPRSRAIPTELVTTVSCSMPARAAASGYSVVESSITTVLPGRIHAAAVAQMAFLAGRFSPSRKRVAVSMVRAGKATARPRFLRSRWRPARSSRSRCIVIRLTWKRSASSSMRVSPCSTT